jgi:hypothetical protein
MPWLLQPKNYTQIARPNLYNVAYRRVGAYKGMGRLHPANYLEIGRRPNRIGATTGQYNTLSGQLSLLPPSLRGLGQMGPKYTCPDGTIVFSTSECPGGQPAPDVQQQIADIWTYITGPPQQPKPSGQPWYQNAGILAAIGVGFALLMVTGRR